MAKISTDEITKQLNVLTKKIDTLQANGAITEAAESLQAAATVGIGRLQDQLPDLLTKLKGGVPQIENLTQELSTKLQSPALKAALGTSIADVKVLAERLNDPKIVASLEALGGTQLTELKAIVEKADLSAKLAEKLPGGLDELNNLFASAEPALQELGKINLLQDFGPAKGGMQSLMKSAEEAIDDAQDKLPKLLREAKPVLTKLDQSMEKLIPDLKTAIPEADLANMEKVFSSPEGLGTNLSTMFEKAQPLLQNAAAITKEVFTDGSVEAIAEELRDITKKDLKQIKNVLEEVSGNLELPNIDEILEKVNAGDFQNNMKSSLETLDKQLSASIDNLTNGGALKGLAEKLTNNIGLTLNALPVTLGNLNVNSIKNDILGGNITAAKDKLFAALPISNELALLIDPTGGKVTINNRADALRLIDIALKNATTDAHRALIDTLKTAGDSIDTKISKDLGTLGGSVTTQSQEAPSNPNPSVDAGKQEKFATLSSKEEIIKYIQSTDRRISSIRVFPIAEWYDETYKNLSAQDAAGKWIINNQGTSAEEDGPGHIYVKRDGTIQMMRAIEKNSITSWAGAEYVLDIVCENYSEKLHMPSKQSDAITDKILPAFFTAFPTGEVYSGFSDDSPKGLVPYFKADTILYNRFNNKRNKWDPESEEKFLSREELILLGRDKVESRVNEMKEEGIF